MYDNPEIYKNFLKWLYSTFSVDEHAFRESLISKLNLSKDTSNVLVTGCGLGDDISSILSKVSNVCNIYLQDLSPQMIEYVRNRFSKNTNIFYSVSNALALPYESNFFDASFHFGGINLFGNMKDAILEMDRVTKSGGRIVFGDEGVSPWLYNTPYSNMVIANNKLWDHKVPIDKLPPTASNVEISWVLGNCFWVIGYTKTNNYPYVNPHIIHNSPRGGSMYTRYLENIKNVLGPI